MTVDMLNVLILGSGTSSGVPLPGCSCPVCSSSDRRNSRTRCSAILSWMGRNILVDTSTDFRIQVLREGIRQIDAVLYTHTHADHLHGIDDLRPFNKSSGEKIPVYGAAETIGTIRKNFHYIFDNEEGYRPSLEAIEIHGPFDLWGVTVIPVPLRHGHGRSLGFRVGSFAYLTDCSAIPEESAPLLAGTEFLVIDGLRFRSHQTHFNISQAIEAAAAIGARRTYLTHLSHDVDHDACSALLPQGVELAYDGLQLQIPLNLPPRELAQAAY